MGRILVGVTPLVGHVKPMLVVAEHLSGQGHDVVFHTSDLSARRWRRAACAFVPFWGTPIMTIIN